MARRAFTLLEVLIAIALTLALLGVMFGFLFNLLGTRDAAIGASERQRAADLLIGRLESDLMTCLVGAEQFGAGVHGDGTSLRIVSRGVAITAGTADAVTRTFADAQRREYRFDEAGRRLEARRSSVQEDDGAFEEIGRDIFRVRFRYHDGASWRESFDSLEAGRLPAAVEVALWFDAWPGETMELEAGADEASTGLDGLSPRMAERETFDVDRMFDEAEAAMLSDLDLIEEPEPDRRRVIIVPDSRPGPLNEGVPR